MTIRNLLFVIVVAAVGAFAIRAGAAPSTGAWVKFGSTTTTKTVSAGNAAVFEFPSGTANSTLITVTASDADVCFDADTGGTGGTGRATLFLALTAAGEDNAAIQTPALVTTNLDCNPIVSGTYWVEIDTAATGGENPVVVIFGR